MATYKKQLRDKDNNIIYPAQGLGTITGENIDWATTAQSYSTDEVNTGATWIDGKKIYKKTVDFGAEPSTAGTEKTVNANITNLDKIIKIEGIGWDNTGSFMTLPASGVVGASGQSNYDTYFYDGLIGICRNNTSFGLTQIYITLYYTKTS